MKKKIISIVLASMLCCAVFAGCGEKEPADSGENTLISSPIIPEGENTENNDVSEPAPEQQVAEEQTKVEVIGVEIPEGCVASELTGLPISADIKDQRPIAVMVDNEVTALDHYGLNDADIIYEMMNSTLNGRITRFMCLVKDWGKIEQFGSVRSARVTNCILTAEWNAVLCHDGGPYEISDFSTRLALPEVDHLSGVFSRVDNGKAREFTEYICTGDLQKFIDDKSISRNYNQFYTGDHFKFAASDPMSYNTYLDVKDAGSVIKLPFEHNGSTLKYNSSTQKYEYSEYGRPHVDGATGQQLTFDNIILQRAEFHHYGEGYLMYYIIGNGEGYYIADGKCAQIYWAKDIVDETQNTQFVDPYGQPVVLKAGKTYIGIVPDDVWDQLVIE